MSFTLGKVYGIPIRLDYSWFIIFLLIVWTVGFDLMPVSYPGLNFTEYLAIGLICSLSLFASILLHELAHSIVAKRNGLNISRITLFLFGGVSEMTEEARNARTEFKVAIAGPLTSIVLAIFLNIAWLETSRANASPLLVAPLQYIGWVNEVVAAFNLIPAFPMDGGRVLRSVIWWRNGDIMKSTITAATVGRWIAYLIMAAGVFYLFFGSLFTGLWLILIGWFVSSGASSSVTQLMLEQQMSKTTAGQIMTPNPYTVPPDMTLSQLHNEMTRLQHNGYPVVQDGKFIGSITIEDFRKVKKELWDATKVADVMTPRDSLVTVTADENGARILHLMGQSRQGRIFVVDTSGNLIGIITKSDVLRMIQSQGLPYPAGIEHVRAISVSKGMYFEIFELQEEDSDWVAHYQADSLQLVRVWVDVDQQGRRIKKFTFQALKEGTYQILLQELAPQGKQKVVRYTINVTQS